MTIKNLVKTYKDNPLIRVFFADPKNQKLLNNNDFDSFFKSYQTDVGRLYTSILTSILIESGIDFLPYLTSTPSYLYAELEDITEITIPRGVKEIGSLSFYDCSNLTTIIIPNTLEQIMESAFDSCSNLKNFIYKGTKEEFNSNIIFRVEKVFKGTQVTKVTCTDGEIELFD